MVTDDCPFLSPERLGLEPRERDALIQTLLLLEAGKMHHIRTGREEPKEGFYPFNMGVWRDSYHCGTTCCIGGTAELVGNLPNRSLATKAKVLYNSTGRDLYKLFYDYPGALATPEKSARALRGYLTTGRTEW